MDFLKGRVLIFDGAMGTLLQAAGLPKGVPPEVWNLERPEEIRRIHRLYREAGAGAVETNTFGANRFKLRQYDLDDSAEAINRRAVELAREGAPGALVAGSMGPTGKLVAPLGRVGFDLVREVYREQARQLQGVDFYLLETFGDLNEIRAAFLGIRDVSDAPVIAQMTFGEDDRTFTGTDPETAVVTLAALGAIAVGANCSGGPEELLRVAERMVPVSPVPVSIQPNAGMPRLENGRTVYDFTPEDFGLYAERFRRIGVGIVGGCCGTTPEHIRAIRRHLADDTYLGRPAPPVFSLSSRTESLFFDRHWPVIIGERLNPTGRAALQEDLRGRSFQLVRRLAREQAEAGANLLDLNVGVPGIPEAEVLPAALQAVQGVVSVPISLDSTDPAALEAALKIYPGKALINSVSGERARLETILPLAVRYGASVIALTLDEDGIPPTAEGRLRVARRLREEAVAAGLSPDRLLVDALVLTVGAQPEEAAETLRAVRLIREELGLATVLGISNVSYGLPRRDILNAAFLALALEEGLSAAMIDPTNERLAETVAAVRLLKGRDPDARYFLAHYGRSAEPAAVSTRPEATPNPLWRALVEGDAPGLEQGVREALAAGADPLGLLQEILIPAIEEVGRLYDEKVYFLPQLVAAGEAMRRAFAVIRPHLPREENAARGKVLLATVEGDIHDIGKNIVAVLLENYGFEVVDLGKDLSTAEILNAVRREKPDLLGLSALMTTTMPGMAEVISALRREGFPLPVLIGGAVTTPEYARQIGAAGWARDAREAVREARRILEGPAAS